MIRRMVVVGIAAAALVGGGVAAVADASTSHGPAPAGHGPGHPGEHRPPVRKFTVVERALTDTTADTGPTGDSLGDVLAFANPIYTADNKTKIGSDNGSCVRTAVGKAYECSWTLTLKDGSLVVEGPFYDAGDSTLAITGGTGKWSGAGGEMRLHYRDAKGSAFDFTYTVRH